MAAPTPDPVTDYLIRHELDPDDVEYLNERLGRLMKVADQLAPLFFEALFKHLPHSKKLFHGDESSQLVMYSSILWSASACLQDPEAAHARLAEIGDSHAKGGIASLQLRAGEAAFLDSLSKMLPKQEFAKRRELWAHLYRIIVDAMQRTFTMAEPPPEDD